jgi:ABC-type multidrug transport system fused ATPase/permease subunit
MAGPRRGGRDTTDDDLPKLKFNKENIKEGLTIFKYIRPYRAQFIAGMVVITLSSISTMSFPFFLSKILDSTESPFGFMGLSAGQIALIMIAILAVQMVISYLRVYFFSYVGENSVADMRKEVYSKMISMNMDFFSKRRVGELSSRVTADISQIQDTITNVFAEILRGILTLVIGIIAIFAISGKMGLVMLSVVPLIVVIAVVFSKYIRKYAKQTQDKLADTGTILQESLQGISNVKAYTNEWFEIGRYNRSLGDMVKLAIQSGKMRGLFIATMIFSLFSTIVLLVWYSTVLMGQGELSVGDLTMFVLFTGFVGGTMAGFADMFSQLQKTLGATQRVRDLLKEETEDISLNEVALDNRYKLRGTVALKNVAFSYPSRKETPVLKDISLEAEMGQQIAIVGPSGAGKSTLISLLLGFYQPDSGSILFDGRDMRSMPLTQLRKQMALVPQDVLLFGGTIFENIAYGKPDASKEEVMEAARKANAHNFISGFPEGYETVVGERGVKLSGGQRQRLAIARAILKDPVILILDEATSSLDSESESLVQEALYNLMKDRTSFVIAHRLSTVRNADKIVVLDGGYVKESGTHSELISIGDGL